MFGVGGLIVAAILLGQNWQKSSAIQWIIQSGLIWGVMVYQSNKHISLNRLNRLSPLYFKLGWGNRLTLFRAWLIAATAGFLLQDWPEGPILAWVPGMIYFVAATLDRVDGYVARRSGQSSLFGTKLDTISDAIGLALASLLAISYGQTHWSFLFMGFAYYAFHIGIYWRTFQGLPIYPLPPAMHRRAWAGFQMGYIVVALWPLFGPPLTLIGGFAFMLPALLGFIIDWLVVSGRINREAEDIGQLFLHLTRISQLLLQPALRIIIVVLLMTSILQTEFPPMANSDASWIGTVATSGFALTSIAIILGVAGRFFALMLIALLGWYYHSISMQTIDNLLFCCVVWSLLLGSGRFSLWQEDDLWLNRYDGA